MITKVTGRNQVTLPASVVHELGIERGAMIEWIVEKKTNGGRFKILPSRGELAKSLFGAGAKYLKPGENWSKELCEEREREDRERTKELV